ncbi:sensor histidine kinase [Amycolatopsis sp. lyj-112]|uniref:sensor histidine kinase n=1 Tax=Amycolatopsis sp. lyj-112 TaxID=2789288 RepID=UPI00397E0619
MSALAARWRAVPDTTQDGLIAAAVLVISLGLPALDGLRGSVSVVSWTVMACVPLLWRRRLPLASAAVTGAITLGSLWLGSPASPWAAMTAVFSAAYHLRRHRVLLALAATAWMLVVAALRGASIVPSDVLTSAGLAVLPVSLGYALRLHADRASALRRLVESEAGRARDRERNRVARDVHDLVGHQLSAIRLQALGSRKAGTDPGRALGAIAELAGEALGQVRSLVDVLREDGSPGLSELDTLTGRMRGALPVDLVLELGDVDLPGHVQAAVYRIVEESLSNIARHASAHRAEVKVSVRGKEVVVTVDDDGGSAVEALNGNGIRGMRERAALLGGTVSAGPREGRGWRVRATIPWDGGSS